jgi:3-hydroxyisobutyrate dehydrogenase-like beta-hydroxyacid dehydrogenase
MTAQTSVAILGLGIIGERWARNLIEDGVPLKTWNRTPKEFPGFTPDAADAVRGAGFIIMVLADPASVSSVLDTIEPTLGPGQTVIQSTTISPEWSKTFAARVEATGARFLEAPFTGSRPAAEERKTVFYLGGDEPLIEHCRPLLERIGHKLFRIGPLGAGSALKLAMNMNIALVMQGLSESLRFARAAGIPDDIYFDALSVNSSRSPLADMKEPKLKAGDYVPQFSLKHMDKDLRLALETAAAAGGLDLPNLARLKAQYDAGMAKGWGDEDFSVLMNLL